MSTIKDINVQHTSTEPSVELVTRSSSSAYTISQTIDAYSVSPTQTDSAVLVGFAENSEESPQQQASKVANKEHNLNINPDAY